MGLFRTTILGGVCLSSLHILWIILVALELVQPFVDFIFKLHMLNSPFKVQPFDISLAIGLVTLTFFFGCFYVLIFFFIKNLMNR